MDWGLRIPGLKQYELAKTTGVQGTCVEALILGGPGVVISGVISPLIWVLNIVTLLITPLKTTHEPPSKYGNPYRSRKVPGVGIYFKSR